MITSCSGIKGSVVGKQIRKAKGGPAAPAGLWPCGFRPLRVCPGCAGSRSLPQALQGQGCAHPPPPGAPSTRARLSATRTRPLRGPGAARRSAAFGRDALAARRWLLASPVEPFH